MTKLFLAGLLSSTTLTACSPDINTTSEITNTSEGIIGGWDIRPTDQFQESIVAVYDATEGQLCTGSLLPNNLVLTAAHCVGPDADAMYILFDTKVTDDSPHRQVVKMEVSPLWESQQDNKKDTGDIALLRFSGPVPTGFKPATLLSPADRKYLRKGTQVVLAGYGINNGVSKEGSGVLRVTKVTIEDPNFSQSEITLNQRQGTGACHGDSGGPAYVAIKGKLYLWGVTSRGVEDKANDCSQLSAYTNALHYRGWLNRAAQKMISSLTSPTIAK